MARIRQIHPEMLRDRKLAALSDRAWRTYSGLLTVCDDEGYAEDDPVMICSDIFPRGGKSPAQVDADLTELADATVLCRYESRGVRYLHVIDFRRWQKPQKPQPSHIKEDAPCFTHCPEQLSLLGDGETTVPLQDSYGSDNGQVREGDDTGSVCSSRGSSSSRGRGSSSDTGGKPPPASARGTRLPDNWQPSLDMLSWAKTEFPAVDARFETDKFRDHWHAEAGAKALKANWDSTWRNWIRRAYPSAGGSAGGRPGSEQLEP